MSPGMRLSDIDLLSELERPELAELRKRFRTRRCNAATVIFHPDSEENVVFVIRSGRVRVYLAYEEKEFTLAILGPGDIFSSHAGTWVQAVEETELLVMDVNEVRSRLADMPEFNTTVVRVLGSIMRNAFGVIERLAFHPVYSRLVELLLQEARPQPDGRPVARLDMTLEQLGLMVGASRQTVSSLLNDMIRDGLLEKRGRGVYAILDEGALRRSAH